ncbi:MAG: PH domain-containing protein [Limisphaerales bacterium]
MRSALTHLETQLAPGERLLWAGQPKAGFHLSRGDGFLIPFGIAWLGFSIFWMVLAFRAPREAGVKTLNILFPLFGIPFVLVGLYLVGGRYWFDARKRARTAYGITNKRILSTRGGDERSFQFLNLDQIQDISVVEMRDRSGTIRFTPSAQKSARLLRWDLIPNVRDVEAILKSALPAILPKREEKNPSSG